MRHFCARKRQKFQLTRPRGARRYVLRIARVIYSFNSRAREGRDLHNLDMQYLSIVSTHAPARGATAMEKRYRWDLECFNSRAREGRDN